VIEVKDNNSYSQRAHRKLTEVEKINCSKLL